MQESLKRIMSPMDSAAPQQFYCIDQDRIEFCISNFMTFTVTIERITLEYGDKYGSAIELTRGLLI